MNARPVSVVFLAPALFLAEETHVSTKALTNVHAELKTRLSSIDLQTISHILVDLSRLGSKAHVTLRRRENMSRYKSQIREVINRNALVTLALEIGYNAYLPVYDGGVDFILYRESDGDLRKVQLKGRWYIDRKYIGRDIWIAFFADNAWYIAPHDKLVALGDGFGFTATRSWREGGAYSCPTLSRAMIEALSPYRMFTPAVAA